MVIHRVRLIVGSVSKLNDYHGLMLLSVTLSRLGAHYKLSLMVGSLSRKSAHFPLIPKHIGSIAPFRVVCGRKGRIVWFFPPCCFPIFAFLFILFFPCILLMDCNLSPGFYCSYEGFSLPCSVPHICGYGWVPEAPTLLLLLSCSYYVTKAFGFCVISCIYEENRQVWFLKKILKNN